MAKNPIFREYIGSGPDSLSDFPGKIINPNISEFHFLLAFAVDIHSNGKGMGTFIPTWNETYFGPDHIRKLKSEHKNAKVVISIGGRGNTYPFNPFEKKSWIDNAEKSLKAIIDGYSNLIDGIDVNYEYINTTSEEEEYVTCIGQLLNCLVNQNLINVVSISPSASVLSQYKELFNNNRDITDWVNYQFYDETLPSQRDFVDSFRSLCATFPSEKLFAGYSSDPKDAGHITPDDFFEGCTYLVTHKLLHGIFIWNANYSATSDSLVSAEMRAQGILVG